MVLKAILRIPSVILDCTKLLTSWTRPNALHRLCRIVCVFIEFATIRSRNSLYFRLHTSSIIQHWHDFQHPTYLPTIVRHLLPSFKPKPPMQPCDDLDEIRLVLGRDEPVPDEELDHDCNSVSSQRVTRRYVEKEKCLPMAQLGLNSPARIWRRTFSSGMSYSHKGS